MAEKSLKNTALLDCMLEEVHAVQRHYLTTIQIYLIKQKIHQNNKKPFGTEHKERKTEKISNEH